MPVPPLRVGIVGCGSAGAAAAQLLARAGHDVQIYERAAALLPVGTGFILQPTGLWVLDHLGLRAEAEAYGARLDGLTARRPDGRRVLDLRYARLATGLYGLGMHRATLLGVLLQGLEKRGVGVHLGAEVESARQERARHWLRVGGVEVGPFDLVVVANGARSAARDWVAPALRAKRYPWGALWSIRPDFDRVFTGRLHQVVDGTRRMLGLLPTGTRSDAADPVPLVSVFWSVRADGVDAWRRRGAAAFVREVAALEPRAEPLLQDSREMDPWAFAEYLDVTLPRWHSDGRVVLGDAAHAMSPQLGQGVNLALWDARELAHALDASPDLASALALYSERRRRHLSFYQYATRWLTPFFQSRIDALGPVRDRIFPLLASLPFFERQMLASMCGLKDGWLASLPTPDAGAAESSG